MDDMFELEADEFEPKQSVREEESRPFGFGKDAHSPAPGAEPDRGPVCGDCYYFLRSIGCCSPCLELGLTQRLSVQRMYSTGWLSVTKTHSE